MNSSVISMDAASAITQISRSTWWRRIAAQAVTRGASDRGRTMLLWIEVAPHIDVSMDAGNHESLFLADMGSADAKNTVGQFFLHAGKHKAAVYWFQLASKQNHPDAMQWLGDCHICGKGVEKNEYLGLMWIAKAAALGHVIAQEQIKELIGRAPDSQPSE
jgi:TPR repeat protein